MTSQSLGSNDARIGRGHNSISTSSSSIDDKVERAIRQAAIEVVEDFEDYSAIRNDWRAAMVAVFEPSEVCLDHSTSSNSSPSSPKSMRQGVFGVYRLKSISLTDSSTREHPFSEEMIENRERFADRSHEGYFSVKFALQDALRKSPKDALNAACAMALEANTLMNLPKHPHICQIYGVHVKGPNAGFANRVLEENYFTIVDEVSETLKQRISAWRKNEAYEEERFDDQKRKQSEITQRLEIVVDIVSALQFLGSQNLVYLFHPGKCGFDSRMSRIMLHDFGHSQESGKVPYFQFSEEKDMAKRVYCAPEVLKGREVTVTADVYAAGMLLWEVLMLKPPFHGMKREQHMKEAVKGEKLPHLSSHLPSKLKKVMTGCWAPDGKRLAMTDVHNKLEELLLVGADLTCSQSNATKSKCTRKEADGILHAERESHTGKRKDGKASSKRISKSESPKVQTPRTKKVVYRPRRGTSFDGAEYDTNSAQSHSSKKTKDSRESRRCTYTDFTRSPSMRARKPKQSVKPSSGKNSRPANLQRSKSMDDSKKMSLAAKSTKSQRSQSMDNSNRASAGRKIKYERKSAEGREKGRENGRDAKSTASRKYSSIRQSKEPQSPRKPLSSRRLTLSPQVVREGASNFLESVKTQVMSIQKNLAGDKEPHEEVIELSRKVDRGRGVRRNASAKKQSSRTLSSRSSPRENIIPASRSFAVRRSLSRGLSQVRNGLSSRSLALLTEDSSRSPRISLTRGSSPKSTISSIRHLKKSSNGLLDTIILGDPSRQTPARSRSSRLSASSPNLFATPLSASSRRLSSDDTVGFQGLVMAREQLVRDGFSVGPPSSPRAPPRSPRDLRGKLKASMSGGLIPASSKDGFGRIKKPAHPRSQSSLKQSRKNVMRSSSPTITLSKRDLSKRPSSGRLNDARKVLQAQ